MNPRLLYEDAGRVARGVRGLVSYLTTTETVDLGLGVFSGDTRTARRGTTSRYEARLASARPRPAAVILRIDIAPAGMPIDGPTRYAGFARRLVVPGPGAMMVAVAYNWLDSAVFILESASLPPDEFDWNPSGPRDAKVFAVTARLLTGEGAPLDTLTIYQALAG